jgi:MYXO-CTERM domain-containing protein
MPSGDYARVTHGRPRIYAFAAAIVVLAGSARAQVTEPDGKVVPGASSQGGETSLAAFFASLGESIDPVAEANTEPAVFSPSCDFEASLVLSQSGNQVTGMAWYNVPADPAVAPDAVYPLVPAGAPLGQTFSSADFRASPSYAGGLIGFVLITGTDQPTPARVYYSESKRNAVCTACAMPGNWKMMLAYRSKLETSTYFLAFEDWGGANESQNPNDYDFNDKVFRLRGVSCAGGGEPCSTTLQGACATGLTQCRIGADVTCEPQIKPARERCDNVDNDCNGVVDDGDGLCPGREICVHGKCIAACGSAEFQCVTGYTCDKGYCVEAECSGKTCPVGQTCRRGACVDPCAGAKCPAGQECSAGRCVDPCAGVDCPDGVCDRGVCVGACGCNGCAAGKACAKTGACVDTGCDVKSCAAGDTCVQGSCQSACAGVVCPGGAECRSGVCDEPSADSTTDEQMPVVIVDPNAGNGGSGGTGSGGAPSATGGDATPTPNDAKGSPHNTTATHASCSCRTEPRSNGAAEFTAVALLALASRRRRARA